MTEENPEERRTRPFADVLTTLQKGKTHRELSTLLQELTQAVIDTGKAGSVQLTIKVSKSKASGMVELVDTVRSKLPEADRSVSLFFVDREHNLTRDDPNQLQFPDVPVRVAGTPEERAAQ